MKNLTMLTSWHEGTNKADSKFGIDMEKNVYFATSESISMLNCDTKKISHCADLPSDTKSLVLGIEYLFESNSIFIAMFSGELYLYNIYDQEVTTVGLVETKLLAFGWSPDQELIILVTGANTLILMTNYFDAICEKIISCDDFGESKPINVGWGSKTTQFHGSEGKGAALIKQKEPQKALQYDTHSTAISWRNDGEFFATFGIDENRGYRQLRIWSKEAVLQFTGELVEGLEESMCWKPHGNVIACSQQLSNVHQIIFFEKNGLRHGQFSLPFKPNTFKVTTLCWNLDGNILLIVAEEISNPQSEYQVMLWTCSNYHWSMKQRLLLPRMSSTLPLIAKWNPFDSFNLHMYNQKSGEFYSFEYIFSILQNIHNNGCNQSIVASIDYKNILISPFGKMIVPPPLCAYMYTVPSQVQSLFFSPNVPAFGAYIGNYTLAFFQKGTSFAPTEECQMKLMAAGGNGFKSKVQPYTFSGLFNMKLPSLDVKSFTLCHFTWSRYGLLCVGRDVSKNLLFSADIAEKFETDTKELHFKVLTELETSVIAMCVNETGNVIAVQLNDGRVLRLHRGGENSPIPWMCGDGKPLIFAQPCTSMSVISIEGKDHVLGLSKRFNLYCNEICLLSNCTSYYVTEEYLVVTTVEHMLKCFSRKKDLADSLKQKGALTGNVQCQNIERGARIISVPIESTKVILQMPRGNLETVHSRALVLSSMCKLLDDLQFSKAFHLAKTHRIDLNVLHDYNPKIFLENIKKVIDQVHSPSDLNLFLASLKNENVCITMYPFIFKNENGEHSWSSTVKINTICDAFRAALENQDINKYYHTLMGTYAKKNPPELGQGLMRLKVLKDSDNEKCTQELVDSSLNFLLYLVDVQELMNVALGTYDLETTIMVAQKSQKDPKEFLPFYNDLQKFNEDFRKYTIDMHLKRYKQALQHISKCDDQFDKCISLIKEQRLYVEALHLFPSSSTAFKTIWSEYGSYLMEKRYFDEAGLVFTRSENFEKALEAYKEANNWQMCLSMSSLLNYSESQTLHLCQEMSDKLRSCERCVDAAYLLEHYVKDIEESIDVLLEGSEWNLAFLMITKYRKDYMINEGLKPVLKQKYAFLKSYMEEMSETFHKHSERLKFLKSQKKKEAELSAATKFAEDDLFSDVGSVTDASSCADSESKISGSIMTRKSSKSRRKQKLKKYRLKEGSADEDLALIAALSETITKVDVLKDNFISTLKALVQFGEDESARELQHLMNDLTKIIETEMTIIWCSPETTDPSFLKYGPESTVNSITASLQQDEKNQPSIRTDPELAAPSWRRIDLELQMLK